jgi:type 1 glutamine amidotransferase
MADLQIRAAVITGQHAFDVPAFTRLFRVLPNVDAYVQTLDDFVADVGEARDWYQVILFYNFHQSTPGDPEQEPGSGKGTRAALERLGQTEQGVVVLHHALLAYREWPLWSDLVGIQERGRGYHPDQHFSVHVEDPGHTITQGIADWSMSDETYVINEPGPDSRVLLTTEHPDSMRSLAWIRTFGKARVFCCALGHGAQAFDNPHFRTVLSRGIQWAARKP